MVASGMSRWFEMTSDLHTAMSESLCSNCSSISFLHRQYHFYKKWIVYMQLTYIRYAGHWSLRTSTINIYQSSNNPLPPNFGNVKIGWYSITSRLIYFNMSYCTDPFYDCISETDLCCGIIASHSENRIDYSWNYLLGDYFSVLYQ